jgi:hypothetical protein
MEVQLTLRPKKKHKTPDSKLNGTAILLYMQKVSVKISRRLAKCYIKTVHRPVKKRNNMLRSVKSNVGCSVQDICGIPCLYGKVYVGQTGLPTTATCKEHERHTQLHQP